MNRFVKLSSESWDVEIYGEKQVLLFTELGRSSCSNVGLENESFQQTYSSTFLKVITQGTGKEVILTFNTIYNSQVQAQFQQLVKFQPELQDQTIQFLWKMPTYGNEYSQTIN